MTGALVLRIAKINGVIAVIVGDPTLPMIREVDLATGTGLTHGDDHVNRTEICSIRRGDQGSGIRADLVQAEDHLNEMIATGDRIGSRIAEAVIIKEIIIFLEITGPKIRID